MTGRIGIITGLAFETKLVSKLSHEMNWEADAPEVRCIGMGGGGARAAAEELAALGVQGLVSFGVAGGLDPALKAGTLVVPETVLDGSGQSWPVDAAWRERMLACAGDGPEIAGGALLAGAGLLTTVAAKQAARRQSGAIAADMESAAIAAAANESGLRFAAVRAVSDEAETALPPAASAMGDGGRLSAIGLLSSLARHPWQVPALIRLGAQTRRACAALDRALRMIGPSLQI